MPTFRQRPLTWLFLIATMCAVTVGLLRDPQGDWFAALVYVQLYVACGWAAVSDAHRLGRGAVLIMASLAVGLIAYVTQRSPDEGSSVLGLSLIVGAVMFIATRVLSILLRSMPGQPQPKDDRRWQISIMELLGWTIVTAIASWAITMSKLPPLENVHGLWSALWSPIPVAVIVAGFLAPRRRHDRFGLVLSIAAVAAFLLVARQWDNQDNSDLLIYGGMFGYVAFWVLVLRLDEAAPITDEAAVTTARDHTEEVEAVRAATRGELRAVRFDEL